MVGGPAYDDDGNLIAGGAGDDENGILVGGLVPATPPTPLITDSGSK